MVRARDSRQRTMARDLLHGVCLHAYLHNQIHPSIIVLDSSYLVDITQWSLSSKPSARSSIMI